MRAFEFFDRNSSGSLMPAEMEDLLYSLGANLSRRYVEDLVDRVIDAPTGKVLYRQLVSTRQLQLT